MSAPSTEREALRKKAGPNGDGLRFRQGNGPVVDAAKLVDSIRTDESLELVEPIATSLTWSANVARRWACDCVDHVIPAAVAAIEDEDDLRPIKGAIRVARKFVDGEVEVGVLDDHFKELFVEEWPTYEGPFAQVVEAARHATARDVGAGVYPGMGTIQVGEWAATAAREARAAANDPGAERSWQTSRLLDYVLGGDDGSVR